MRKRLARIEEHARRIAARSCEEVACGPFAALFAAAEDPWQSYAVPSGPSPSAASLPGHVAVLRTLFAAKNRVLRVELAPALDPQLALALAEAGLAVEAEVPLVAATPQSIRPAPASRVTTRFVAPTDDHAFLAALMRQGLEVRGPVEPDEVAALRAAREHGVRYGVAHLDGLPCGSGCLSPDDSVAEIAAVSVVPTMRRRGVASALAAALARAHFDAGGELAWATAGDDAAYGLFQKLGFDDAGVRVIFTDRAREAAPPG